jgi:hypothetical protein
MDGNYCEWGIHVKGQFMPRPSRKGFRIETWLVTIIRLTQPTLKPSFNMLPPLCMYFYYESSLKIVRMSELGSANHVVRLVLYNQ